MKKKLVGILSIVLAMIIGMQSMVLAGTGITVNQTSSKVLVNGVMTEFEAYTIGGSNYFKLRDIATVISGSEKQFEVTWDGVKNAINLISNAPYTSLGTEMSQGDGKPKQATLNTSIIYKDGNKVQLTAYTIGGSNFFKLRDLGQTFNFGVDWDESTSTIAIDTSKNYVAPPAPPAPVVVGTWYTPKYQDEFTQAVGAFSEGYFVGGRLTDQHPEDPIVTIYDASMKLLFETKYTLAMGGFQNGLLAVGTGERDEETYSELYGFIDTTGKEVIPCVYYHITTFKNGLAIVHQRVDGKELTLIINTKGDVKYTQEGIVWGEIRGGAVYIDEQNRGSVTDFGGSLPVQSGSSVSSIGVNEFPAKYGSLYGSYDYIGAGFYRVTKLISSKLDDWDLYDQQQQGMNGVVDINNKVIVPMGSQFITPVETENSFYFEVEGIGVYSAAGKKVLAADKYSHVRYAGNNAIYYYQEINEGWGLMLLTGTDVVPGSENMLSYFDYELNKLWNFNDYYYAIPIDHITFYTTAKMDVKADTTKLKSFVAKAKVILADVTARAKKDASLKDLQTDLNKKITKANEVLASSNPTWIDVASVEVALQYFYYWAKRVVEDPDNN